MGLDSAAVTSRSNSALLHIEMVGDNTALSSEARMEAIYQEVLRWHTATDNSPQRFSAKREYKRAAEQRRLFGRLTQRGGL